MSLAATLSFNRATRFEGSDSRIVLLNRYGLIVIHHGKHVDLVVVGTVQSGEGPAYSLTLSVVFLCLHGQLRPTGSCEKFTSKWNGGDEDQLGASRFIDHGAEDGAM